MTAGWPSPPATASSSPRPTSKPASTTAASAPCARSRAAASPSRSRTARRLPSTTQSYQSFRHGYAGTIYKGQGRHGRSVVPLPFRALARVGELCRHDPAPREGRAVRGHQHCGRHRRSSRGKCRGSTKASALRRAIFITGSLSARFGPLTAAEIMARFASRGFERRGRNEQGPAQRAPTRPAVAPRQPETETALAVAQGERASKPLRSPYRRGRRRPHRHRRKGQSLRPRPPAVDGRGNRRMTGPPRSALPSLPNGCGGYWRTRRSRKPSAIIVCCTRSRSGASSSAKPKPSSRTTNGRPCHRRGAGENAKLGRARPQGSGLHRRQAGDDRRQGRAITTAGPAKNSAADRRARRGMRHVRRAITRPTTFAISRAGQGQPRSGKAVSLAPGDDSSQHLESYNSAARQPCGRDGTAGDVPARGGNAHGGYTRGGDGPVAAVPLGSTLRAITAASRIAVAAEKAASCSTSPTAWRQRRQPRTLA